MGVFFYVGNTCCPAVSSKMRVPTSIVKVLVVDDFEPWCRLVCSMLKKQPELLIVGEATNGLEALQKASELQPDLILLDVGLPSIDGIEVARKIRGSSSKTKILFASQDCSPDTAQAALGAGAAGYIVKSEAGRELLLAINAVLRGVRFVSARLHLDTLTPPSVEPERHHRPDNPYLQFRRSTSISEFLACVIDATAADFGTLQLFDSTNGVLRIVAQKGFETEFIDYFDTVRLDHGSACSAAMSKRSRMVVMDVAADPLLSNDSKGVLLRARVRSVQSTPLIDPSGSIVGMVSTHYNRPGGPMLQTWKSIDDLASNFLFEILSDPN